jgi:multidrug efflux pump subunit AcrA (membrane-fusion protein)
MKKSTIGFFVVVGILLLAIVAVGIQLVLKKNRESVQVQEAVVPVAVMEVKLGSIEDIIDLTGYIDPEETVNVISKIPGKFIRKAVEEGAYVARNQVIAYVNRDEPGVQFESFPVRSPFEGVVAKFNFDAGAMVSPQFPLAVVVKVNKVRIKTSVVEKDFAKVKMGQEARVLTDAYSDRIFEGRVTRIAPTMDASSHTAEVEVSIPNPERLLKPGMFVRVELVVDEHEGVPVIPKTVVSKRMGKDMIFVFNPATGLVEMRESQLGFYDLNNYEILGGVKAGELVVAEDQAILQDGIKASIAKRIGEEPAPKPEEKKESPEKAEGK